LTVQYAAHPDHLPAEEFRPDPRVEEYRPQPDPPARRKGDRPFKWMLFFLGTAVALALLAMKSSQLHHGVSITVIAYSVLVTSFELSRLLAATLHRDTLNHCYRHDDSYEPTATFVIPCMNEQDAIAHTVRQCLSAEYPREKLEVIVVNDGSTDRTPEILDQLQRDYPELVVVNWSLNRGKRYAMAEGFRLARGEIIIQLDSDSYIEPAGLRHLVAPFVNPEIGGVCAHADPTNADQNVLTRMQAAYYFVSFRILKAAESSFMAVFCCSGCSSAYRRELVMPILDEWLKETFLGLPVTWGDDRALTNRILAAGYRTIYTDRAQAFTICPDNLRTLIKQQVRWKKGWLVNSIFASRFIARTHPFVAFTYFFPLIALTVLTPLVAARALIYEPLVHHTLSAYYVAGVFSIAVLVTIFYRHVQRGNKYWPYVFAWSALNMFVLSFVMLYAVATIQNRRWGTRIAARHRRRKDIRAKHRRTRADR
jgi:hyaluronan synthase